MLPKRSQLESDKPEREGGLPKIPERKAGQRKENYHDETLADSLKCVKQQIRCDWGGKDPVEQIQRMGLEVGIKFGPQSAAVVRAICEKQMEGSRKRTAGRLDYYISKDSPAANIIEELP